MNVSAVDLNLLKVFAALYAERHVTRAGARIGLAQPSMSNALGRLRAIFADELFVRSPEGMRPTERAMSLAPKIEAALDLLAEALEEPATFDPATATAELTLATSDNIILTFGTAVMCCFQRVAPGFDLRLRHLSKDTVYGELDRGEIDLAIGAFPDIPARFHQRDFLSDEFVCIARRDHPDLQNGLTLEAFARLSHILTTFRADKTGEVDRALAERGLERRVALTVAQFGVVPDIIAKTDCIATMPRSAAQLLAVRSGCALYPVPLEMLPWTMTLIWSAATQASPAKRFAVEEVRRLATS